MSERVDLTASWSCLLPSSVLVLVCTYSSKVRGVGRVWEGQNVVFHQNFICGNSPVSRGIVMVQDPITGTPLLRAMSAHSITEVLQDCFVEFLLYRLSSRDALMMNQPVNVEERN